jgi:hypothetical protein
VSKVLKNLLSGSKMALSIAAVGAFLLPVFLHTNKNKKSEPENFGSQAHLVWSNDGVNDNP